MSGTINKISIQKKIFESKNVKRQVREIAKKTLDREKQLLQDNFDSHPVTQELKGGPDASNNSGTLGGYGNLFSFLGFKKGANPVQPVKNLIERISLDRKVGANNKNFIIKVKVPSKNDFNMITRLPWESGRSWLFDIERGISGLSAYLYGRFSGSRSGGGIQSKYDYSGRVFRPVKYFNEMYDKFLKNIKK